MYANFHLVRQLVFLVCINSALIMSPPARTINKTPLKNLYFHLLVIKLSLKLKEHGGLHRNNS